MTALLYAGAAMLTLGMVGLVIGLLIMVYDDVGLVASAIAFLVTAPLTAGLSYAMLSSIEDRDSPILVTLHKGQWACVQSHRESVTTYVMVGKVMVPVTSSHSVCDQYARAS